MYVSVYVLLIAESFTKETTALAVTLCDTMD